MSQGKEEIEIILNGRAAEMTSETIEGQEVMIAPLTIVRYFTYFPLLITQTCIDASICCLSIAATVVRLMTPVAEIKSDVPIVIGSEELKSEESKKDRKHEIPDKATTQKRSK